MFAMQEPNRTAQFNQDSSMKKRGNARKPARYLDGLFAHADRAARQPKVALRNNRHVLRGTREEKTCMRERNAYFSRILPLCHFSGRSPRPIFSRSRFLSLKLGAATTSRSFSSLFQVSSGLLCAWRVRTCERDVQRSDALLLRDQARHATVHLKKKTGQSPSQ